MHAQGKGRYDGDPRSLVGQVAVRMFVSLVLMVGVLFVLVNYVWPGGNVIVKRLVGGTPGNGEGDEVTGSNGGPDGTESSSSKTALTFILVIAFVVLAWLLISTGLLDTLQRVRRKLVIALATHTKRVQMQISEFEKEAIEKTRVNHKVMDDNWVSQQLHKTRLWEDLHELVNKKLIDNPFHEFLVLYPGLLHLVDTIRCFYKPDEEAKASLKEYRAHAQRYSEFMWGATFIMAVFDKGEFNQEVYEKIEAFVKQEKSFSEEFKEWVDDLGFQGYDVNETIAERIQELFNTIPGYMHGHVPVSLQELEGFVPMNGFPFMKRQNEQENLLQTQAALSPLKEMCGPLAMNILEQANYEAVLKRVREKENKLYNRAFEKIQKQLADDDAYIPSIFEESTTSPLSKTFRAFSCLGKKISQF